MESLARLNEIPRVLLFEVFLFFDVQELQSAEGVCKLWNTISLSSRAELLWKRTYEQHRGILSTPKFTPLALSSSRERLRAAASFERNLNEGIASLTRMNFHAPITSVSCSFQNAVTDQGDSLRVWDMNTLECTATHYFKAKPEFKPVVQGHQLLMHCYYHSIKIWDLTASVCLQSLEGHKAILTSLVIARSHAASSSLDLTLRVWDVCQGLCMSITTLPKPSTALCFADQKARLLSAEEEVIRVFDVDVGKFTSKMEGHEKAVRTIHAGSRWGSIVASGSDDHTIRLWDVRNNQCVQILKDDSPLLRLRVEGRRLLSMSDHVAKIWECRKGSVLSELVVNQVSAMDWDACTIVCGYQDGDVCLMDFSGLNVPPE